MSAPSPPLLHWCYHCEKRVPIESPADLPDVICFECKRGFVESLPPSPPPHRRLRAADPDDPPLSDQFLQVLRLIAQAAREDHAPTPSDPADPSDAEAAEEEEDYLGFDFRGWYDDDDDDDDHINQNNQEGGETENPVQIDENREEVEEAVDVEEEEEVRRWRDVLRRRLIEDQARRRRREALREEGELGGGAATRRNRILDWAEILLGLEDNSIDLRLQMPEVDTYVGNPGDYVDAAGYEELLQNLAESDNGGRRGAPPAAKVAVEGLETVVMNSEEEVIVCAVCKDLLNVGESAKKMPCGHRYHGDCIVPWLSARNSCPICRFELPTDDPEYEEERKKMVKAGRCSSGGGSTSTAPPSSAGGDIE